MKIKGIYFLYRFLQALGLPVLLFYFLFRGLRNHGYLHSLPQRLGFIPRSLRQTGPGAIWLHAVSVGEILSCVELVRRLRSEFPNTRIFVSSTTLAGHATATEKLQDLAHGVFFAPVDYVFAVRRLLRTLQPSTVIIAETEIWPNLFREVHRTGAGLTIVNARISDRAWPRYQRLRRFFQAVLPAADSILAQTDAIRDRFLELGAPPGTVRTTGNFKYDFDPRPAAPDSPVLRYLDRVRPAQVWIAASTMPPATAGDVDEDDAVIAAYRELAPRHPELFLILVPRKPERFDATARKLEAAGIDYVRRSALPDTTRGRVLLLDTIGELSGLFSVADVVFMGGTLAQRGGHNILEPALFAQPVIVGPHMENFQAIADDFRTAGACVEIAGAEALTAAVAHLLGAPVDAREIGRRAQTAAEARRGATARAVDEIRRIHRIPCYRPAQPWYATAWVLAGVWRWGGRRRHTKFLMQQRRIDAPVISVGNLTMGGTGKTPAVLRLAELLKARGRKPGILTRGYGRGSTEKDLVVPPGAEVPAERTGDEPQIFVRSGLAPVGIGANRYRAGMRLRNECDVDVLLLDDGFQHLKVARDVDILLIDALNPFGGGSLFPLGRLREPLAGLARADIVLITRGEFSDLTGSVSEVVRRWNPTAPVFHSAIEPRGWVENRTGQQFPVLSPPFERPAMFCGLGNPESFRRTLAKLGIVPVDFVDFDDHHRYRPDELRRLVHQFQAQGAAAVITTEKDAVNLCDACDDLMAPLPLYWLKISTVIANEPEFLAAIDARI